MKTININLIDDQTKESNKSKIEVLSDNSDIDPKVKFASIVIVVCVCVVFITSCGIWSISSVMLKKTGKDLADLKLKHEKVSLELAKSKGVHKNLETEKKILEAKLIAKKTINSSLLPWHKILLDISKAVPKNIKITEISEATEVRNVDHYNVVTIKGQIPSGKSKNDSLKSISFFILNINENAPVDSSLENATVRKFDFDNTANIYNFEIASTLKVGNDKDDKDEK